MTEPVRRNLLAGLDRLAPAKPEPDEAQIAAVAERHGFAKPEAAAAPAPEPAPAAPSPAPRAAVPTHASEDNGQQVVMRRKRKLLGRTQQFNVRLRPETVDIIYDEANSRDVPIAQVIEEMVDAFQAARGRAAH